MNKFTVYGQPVPYLRMTRGEVWLMKLPEHRVKGTHITKWRGVKRYLEWKATVLSALLSETTKFNPDPKTKLYMNIKIYFQNKKHGDPDNIWKGIADSIFKNDKYVSGSFDYWYDADNPRTVVAISTEHILYH